MTEIFTEKTHEETDRYGDTVYIHGTKDRILNAVDKEVSEIAFQHRYQKDTNAKLEAISSETYELTQPTRPDVSKEEKLEIAFELRDIAKRY